MRRSKRSKKRTNAVAKAKGSGRSGVVYSPQLPPPPPPPSVPATTTATEKTLNGSPITISSQKELENLVSNIEKNSQPPSPLSTPPVTKADKSNSSEEEEEEEESQTKTKKKMRRRRGKRKSKEESDEDYIETGEGSEDEEDSDFDDNVESSVDENEDDEEDVDQGEKNRKGGSAKKRTKGTSKLPQAVRNRIAAQEFRQRQKTYIFELEQRVDALSRVNANVYYRLRILVHENSVLRYHLSFLRDFISKVSLPSLPSLPQPTSSSTPSSSSSTTKT